MATVINTTPAQTESSGVGFLLGVMLLIAFLVGLFYYGGAIVRTIVPQSTNVTVPEEVDVNIRQGQ